MKYNLKKIILLLLYYLLWNRQDNGLLVLTYHRITDTTDYDDPLKVSKKIFEKQIQIIKEKYKIISGDELLEIIQNKKTFPENTCLITFDDGWKDNYTNAYPILKKYNIPAIIFISTDFINTNKIFWHEQLQEILNHISNSNSSNRELDEILLDWHDDIRSLIKDILEQPKSKRQMKINVLITKLKLFETKKIHELINKLAQHFDIKLLDERLVLTWNEIIEMSKNNISFGSHTKSHAILTQIDKIQVIEELKGSKNIIEEKLSMPVKFLSYPNGNFNEIIMKTAKDAKYKACFSCIPGFNKSFESSLSMKRLHINEYSSMGFGGKFSELFFKVDLSNVKSYLKIRQ